MSPRRLAAAAALSFFCAPAFAAVEYTGKNFSDPFSDGPPAAAGAADAEKQMSDMMSDLAALTVQGIVVSPDGNLAIIKGSVVRVGDKLKSYSVHSIDVGGVVLTANVGGQTKYYKLQQKGQTAA